MKTVSAPIDEMLPRRGFIFVYEFIFFILAGLMLKNHF
jgi:hypothetical protein